MPSMIVNQSSLEDGQVDIHLQEINESRLYDQPDKGATDVILVVKGAGMHAPDEVLDAFVECFWPAVLEIDREATIRQRADCLEDHVAPPHDEKPHKDLIEVSSKLGDQTIWIKEVYWEPEIKPPNPFRSLLDEWHMATFAFRREFSMLIRKILEWGSRIVDDSFLPSFLLGMVAEPVKGVAQGMRGKSNPPSDTMINVISTYLSFWLSFFVMLLWIMRLANLEDFLVNQGIIQRGSNWPLFIVFLATFVITSPSFIRIRSRDEFKTRLPGFQNWILFIFGIAVLISPVKYLFQLLQLGTVVVVINVIRALLWKRRPFQNIDTDYFVEELLEMKGKRTKVTPFPFAVLNFFYRWLVIWLLPIAFPLLLLSRLFTLIGRLGFKDLGSSIEAFISERLSSGLGDVSAYAMSQSQAVRVRSVLESDIRYFSDKCEDIHVVAHSQGTALSWESLFVHLEDEYREKIKTYVTLGSVLTYYYQTSPVLSEIYPSHRFRLEKSPKFANGFKWFNCWNLADQVTGFHGLGEYRMLCEGAWVPIEVKTRSPILSGHGDYLNNIEEVFQPLANRVLGITKGKVWPSDNGYTSNDPAIHRWNRSLSLLIVPSLLAIFATFAALSTVSSSLWNFSAISVVLNFFDIPENFTSVLSWLTKNSYFVFSASLILYLISKVSETGSLFRALNRIRVG
jgi:hypothetical protein